MANESKKYIIFISWHDDKHDKEVDPSYSKAVAEEYKRFIEFVFEREECAFCSAVDIIGSWRENLKTQLRDCDYAVFVITDKAIESGWLHAEYGAFMMKSILQSENPDYENLFPVCELKGNNDVSISGPIKDLQVFYPVCDNDPSKAETFKKKFKELLFRIPIDKPNFETLFVSNYDIFRKRIEEYKKRGTANSDLIQQIYQYKTVVPQVIVPSIDKETDSLRPLLFWSRTDIIDRFDVIEKIKERLDNHSVVNVIGMGGCGKTTITYSFYNNYCKDFTLTTGVVINNSFYEDFDEEFTDVLGIDYNCKDGKKDYEETFNHIVSLLKQYDCKRDNGQIYYNLLILDVNEKSKYHEVEDALKVLRKELNKKWKFLVVSRETVNPNETATVDLYNLEQIDDKILKKIFNHYLDKKSRYYDFSDEQFLALFDKLGYLPLLVEQLAYFLVAATKPLSFDGIMTKLGDKVLHSDFANKKLKKGERYEKEYEIIGEFLSKLMVFHERLSPEQRNIARYFMMWPAQYYRVDLIQRLTGLDDLDNELNRLSNQCVLDKKDDNGYASFKMHGLIAESFRDQVFTKDENREYRNFTSYLSKNIFAGLKEEDHEIVGNCIKFSLANFASFDEWYLLQKAYQYAEGDIYETALKIKILKLADNRISDVDIYKRIVGMEDDETKDNSKKTETADQLYYAWLNHNPEYSNSIPSDGIVEFIGKDGNIHSFKMIKVDGGEFLMGAQKQDKSKPNYDGDAYDDESPVHKVSVNNFYIGETQVTQGLWEAVLGKDWNPSSDKNGDVFPVESVTWYDCLNFIIELNRLTKLKFRLPTEAEWEYAARGGQRHSPYKYSGSNNIDDVAWYADNTGTSTCAVKTRKENDLGIYDMSGNVYEWCQDWYGDYPNGAVSNPTGPSSGSSRVLRGGSWRGNAFYCRVSDRNYDCPDFRLNFYGYRLALPFPS